MWEENEIVENCLESEKSRLRGSGGSAMQGWSGCACLGGASKLAMATS